MIQAFYEPHAFEGMILPFIFFTRETSDLPVYRNWHSDIEIIYCISGEARMFCDDATYELKAGDLFVVNPYKSHAIQISRHTKYQCLIVSEKFCKENGISTDNLYFQEHLRDVELASAFQNAARAYYEVYADRSVHPVSVDSFVTEAFRTDLLQNESNVTDTARIRYHILGFLISLCERYILDYKYKKEISLDVQRVMEITLYIRKHLSEMITLDMISDNLGVCKSHLSREFKKVTNMTIVEYINFLRCNEVKSLLAEGYNVSASANAAGFNNLSYFTRTYKKYMGALPSCHMISYRSTRLQSNFKT